VNALAMLALIVWIAVEGVMAYFKVGPWKLTG